MKTSPVFIFSSAAVIAGGWLAFAALAPRSAQANSMEPVIHQPYDSNLIDTTIAAGERATRLDPENALHWSRLASSYLARARESDDSQAAQKAEAACRRSLTLRSEANQGARNKLVSSLLAQHRFTEALAACRAAIHAKVYDDQTLRNLTDCLIEVGKYPEAAKTMDSHQGAFADASGWAIRARLLDLTGRPEDALRLLDDAQRSAERSPGMPSDAIAWFHVRHGLQLAKTGRHEEANKEFTRALELYPRDYRAMNGLAKVAFQDGRWRDVIHWGTRSDPIAPMPETRSLMGDAFRQLGDQERAEKQYQSVAELIGRPSGPTEGLHESAAMTGGHGHRLDRQYAMFCADHGLDLEGAYAAAIRDFDSRQDIYAYDTLAWVYAKNGRLQDASMAMGKALATGSRDPMLHFHAAEIARALGQQERAAKEYRAALEIDPAFDGIAADRARAEVSR